MPELDKPGFDPSESTRNEETEKRLDYLRQVLEDIERGRRFESGDNRDGFYYEFYTYRNAVDYLAEAGEYDLAAEVFVQGMVPALIKNMDIQFEKYKLEKFDVEQLASRINDLITHCGAWPFRNRLRTHIENPELKRVGDAAVRLCAAQYFCVGEYKRARRQFRGYDDSEIPELIRESEDRPERDFESEADSRSENQKAEDHNFFLSACEEWVEISRSYEDYTLDFQTLVDKIGQKISETG